MELLTVIAIISILMALLLPVLGAAKNSARKAQAHTDCSGLVVACRAYYNDYGVYPLTPNQANAGMSQNGGWDTCYGDPNPTYDNAYLCDILRAVDETSIPGVTSQYQLNTRQVIYLEVNQVHDSSNPKGGIYFAPANGSPAGTPSTPYSPHKILSGSYLDPWGMEYVVFLNSNYNGNLSNAMSWGFYAAPVPVINTGVAACSLGMDQMWGTKGNGLFANSDDIATWQ